MRRVTLIGTMFGVAALTPFLIELAATTLRAPGLARFVAFSHRGNG